jgi:hypothetical protein
MWALLTVGQRHAIGQNWIVVLAQRKLEWGDSRGELGEICCNPTATSEGAYAVLVKRVVSFQMRQGICFIVAVLGQIAIIPSLDLVIVRMGLKEDPDFDFNGF